jgi:hypothetical protein
MVESPDDWQQIRQLVVPFETINSGASGPAGDPAVIRQTEELPNTFEGYASCRQRLPALDHNFIFKDQQEVCNA